MNDISVIRDHLGLGIDDPIRVRNPDDWLAILDCYQKTHGHGQAPSKNHKTLAGLAQWIQRQRRRASHGTLPIQLAAALISRGIGLAPERWRLELCAEASAGSFDRHFVALEAWVLERIDPERRVADISWGLGKNSPTVAAHYRFLEHMRLKARHGNLEDEQYQRLDRLRLTVSGKRLGDWLDVPATLRPEERHGAADGELNTVHPAHWLLVSQPELSDSLEHFQRTGAWLYREDEGVQEVEGIYVSEAACAVAVEGNVMYVESVRRLARVLCLDFGLRWGEGVLFAKNTGRAAQSA